MTFWYRAAARTPAFPTLRLGDRRMEHKEDATRLIAVIGDEVGAVVARVVCFASYPPRRARCRTPSLAFFLLASGNALRTGTTTSLLTRVRQPTLGVFVDFPIIRRRVGGLGCCAVLCSFSGVTCGGATLQTRL